MFIVPSLDLRSVGQVGGVEAFSLLRKKKKINKKFLQCSDVMCACAAALETLLMAPGNHFTQTIIRCTQPIGM